MKAIILAAGLGTRLKNITSCMPKALVPVNGKTMLEIVIQNLKSQGITKFLINIHHFGDDIIKYLNTNKNFGVSITISDERNQLLDTGGAILKAHNFVEGNEPILVHNVDIISNLIISKLLKYHTDNNNVATLCVRNRSSNRGLLFNNKMHLVGWTNVKNNEFRWVDNKCKNYHMFAFSGIYIISPEFTTLISQSGTFSIIDTWLDLAKNNTVAGYVDESDLWHDLGTAQKIELAERLA